MSLEKHILIGALVGVGLWWIWEKLNPPAYVNSGVPIAGSQLAQEAAQLQIAADAPGGAANGP